MSQDLQKQEKKTISLAEFKKNLEAEGLRLQRSGEIEFPPDYSVSNAVKGALLQIEQTEDRNHVPAIKACSLQSIYQAVISTLAKGLNPLKSQCYYIVYGKSLTMTPSPYGRILMAKRADPNIVDIIAQVVYEGDKFTYSFKRGKKVVTEHEQQLDNVDKNKIVAAYATVIYKDREESTIMTFNEIKQAWQQSPVHPFDEKGNIKASSTHGKFTAEMCKKTVINAATKPIIRSSDDSDLELERARIHEEIDEHANKIPVGFSEPEDEPEQPEQSPECDHETGEVKEDVPEEKPAQKADKPTDSKPADDEPPY